MSKNSTAKATTVRVLSVVLIVAASGHAQSAPPSPQSPDELVAELREFSAALPAAAPSNGVPDPREERRHALYDRLWSLGTAALPALSRGLANPDVQVRRNVALFLGAAGGTWYEPTKSRLDIRLCLGALTVALADPDARVRQLAAQAVGAIGAEASAAVPALIALLASPDEGSRNSACIGLTGIGSGAREALPALHRALSDPSADVRRFAQRAIDTIEKAPQVGRTAQTATREDLRRSDR